MSTANASRRKPRPKIDGKTPGIIAADLIMTGLIAAVQAARDGTSFFGLIVVFDRPLTSRPTNTGDFVVTVVGGGTIPVIGYVPNGALSSCLIIDLGDQADQPENLIYTPVAGNNLKAGGATISPGTVISCTTIDWP